MTQDEKNKLGKTLWAIADRLRGSMDADDFRDYMLAFLFLRYLSDNYEAAAKRELGSDYPALNVDDRRAPLTAWYADNAEDIPAFEKQMRRKVHYVVKPQYLWSSISEGAMMQDGELLNALEAVLKYI
jgi:type I restriction enzyme M protein